MFFMGYNKFMKFESAPQGVLVKEEISKPEEEVKIEEKKLTPEQERVLDEIYDSLGGSDETFRILHIESNLESSEFKNLPDKEIEKIKLKIKEKFPGLVRAGFGCDVDTCVEQGLLIDGYLESEEGQDLRRLCIVEQIESGEFSKKFDSQLEERTEWHMAQFDKFVGRVTQEDLDVLDTKESSLEGLRNTLDPSWGVGEKENIEKHIKFFQIPEEEVKSITEELYIENLAKGQTSKDDFENLDKLKVLDKDIINTKEAQEAAIVGLKSNIKHGSVSTLEEDLKFLGIEESVLTEDPEFNSLMIEGAKKSFDWFLLNEENIKEFSKRLNVDDWGYVLEDEKVRRVLLDKFRESFTSARHHDRHATLLEVASVYPDFQKELIVGGLKGAIKTTYGLNDKSVLESILEAQKRFDFDDDFIQEAVRQTFLVEEMSSGIKTFKESDFIHANEGYGDFIKNQGKPLSPQSEELVTGVVLRRLSDIHDFNQIPYDVLEKYGINIYSENPTEVKDLVEKKLIKQLSSGTPRAIGQSSKNLRKFIDKFSPIRHKVFFVRREDIHKEAMGFLKRNLNRDGYQDFFQRGEYKDFCDVMAISQKEYQPLVDKAVKRKFFEDFENFKYLTGKDSGIDMGKINLDIKDEIENDWKEVKSDLIHNKKHTQGKISYILNFWPELQPLIDDFYKTNRDALENEDISADSKLTALFHLSNSGEATKSENEKIPTGVGLAMYDLSKYVKFYRQDLPAAEKGQIDSKKMLGELVPWSDSLVDLYNLKKPAKEVTHDPWVQELDPLVKHMTEAGVISYESKKDGEIVLDFVKRMGMQNTPELFKVFVEISRAEKSEDISLESREGFKKHLDIDIENLMSRNEGNTGVILKELEQFKEKVFHGFLENDKSVLEGAIESVFISETFDLAKGVSGHSQQASTSEVIEEYLEHKQKYPEKFELPYGYDKTSFSVKERASELEAKDSKNEKEKVLNNKELKTHLTQLRDIMNETFYNELRIDIFSDFFEEEYSETEKNIDFMEKQGNEKAVFGLKRKLENLKKSQKDFEKIIDSYDEYLAISEIPPDRLVYLMESVSDLIPDNHPSKKSTLMTLSLAHMKSALSGTEEFLVQNTAGGDDEKLVNEASLFTHGRIGEHYLNKKHNDGEYIGTENKRLLKSLEKHWQTKDFDNSILSISNNKLKELETGVISEKEREIVMTPSKEIPLIFSGDLGGACTSSRTMELARGEYEDITGYSFVIDPGSKQERFVGSCLFIETETDSGEKIIVVRANNPAENLGTMVDSDSLIEKTIEEAKNVAKRRGIKNVGVVLSGTHSRASTNRKYVIGYYKEHFKENEKVGLKKDHNTKFNRYDIWDKEGPDPTVLISVE